MARCRNKINNASFSAPQLTAIAAATLLLVAGNFLASCRAQCLTGNDNPALLRPEAATQLSDGRFDFAIESLKKIAEIEPTDNVFFSPHSLHEALGLAYYGSRGSTEAALKRALHVPQDFSKVDVQRFYAFEKSIDVLRKVSFGTVLGTGTMFFYLGVLNKVP